MSFNEAYIQISEAFCGNNFALLINNMRENNKVASANKNILK